MVKAWSRYRTLGVHVRVDDRDSFRRTPFLVVANGRYTLTGMNLATRRALDGGRLSIYVAPADGRFGVLTLPLRVVTGRLEADSRFETFQTMEATIDTRHRRVSVALDGEVLTMRPPVSARIRPRSLRTIVASPSESPFPAAR